MSEQAATWQRVTVADAAAALGVSTATVRRMVRRGQLEGERVQRPQGIVYVVKLPVDGAVPVQEPPATRRAPGDTSRGSVQGDDRSQAMATWAASLLGPIAAELGEARQSILGQAETIRDQAETIGRQGAELAAERERGRMYHAEAERARDELATAEAFRRRNSRRLTITIALVVAATLALAAGLAPAWVR